MSNTFDRHPYLKDFGNVGEEDLTGFENDFRSEAPQFQDSVPDESTTCCGNALRRGPNGRGCPECPIPSSMVRKKQMSFDEWYSQSGWAARTKAITIFPEALEILFRSIWQKAQENV